MDILRFVFCLSVFTVFYGAIEVSAQESAPTDTDAAAELVERAENTVSILQPLLDLERSLEDQIAAIDDTTGPDQDETSATELERLRSELQDVQEQISVVLTGVSERVYLSEEDARFDLNAEVQNLIEPFVLVLNEATRDARELERARRGLDVASRRLADAELAIENIEAVLTQTTADSITERLNANLLVWQERLTIHQTQVDALAQRIADLQSTRLTVGRNVNSAFQVFFRDRGISLIMGIGAFLGLLVLCRFVLFVANRAISRREKEKTFSMRLAGVLFGVFSIFASFGAMLAVFNMRNDWLLLGLAMLLFVAGLWIAIRMLPSLIEQLWVLLNLGAVQERERVLFHGVPFRVEKLSFFTDLVNPTLDGGEFTLPVRELVGMHSRPAAQDEAWFPSEKGDWVRLSDGNAGKVIAQTPEMVVVQLLGGARTTYQTGDYLAANPENLSHGYRVEIEFGIGYRHQEHSVDEILHTMKEGVSAHFTTLLNADELRRVDVEFLRAGASSLDYEVEIDVAGSSAHRFEELERELARCLVSLANRHGWEIPFQQVVLHQAPRPQSQKV